MSNKHLEDNPFSALFSNATEAENFSQHIQISDSDDNMNNANLDKLCSNNQQNENSRPQFTNKVIEGIFAFTINRQCSFTNIVYLEDLASSSKTPYLNEENLGTAIFERLLLGDPENFILNREEPSDSYKRACEKNIISYLFHSYEAVQDLKHSNPKVYSINDNLVPTMEDLLIINASTCLKQPDIFPTQQFGPQILSIFLNECAVPAEAFFTGVVIEFARGSNDEEVFSELKPSFTNVLKSLHREIVISRLFDFKPHCLRLLKFFSRDSHLARVLFAYSTPSSNIGYSYSDTLIGSLLCLSSLPKTQNGRYEFYDNVIKQQPNTVDWTIWSQIKPLHDNVYDILHNLLTCSSDLKSQTLNWISDCIHSNAGRGKLWNSFNVMVGGSKFVSDAFMLNFESVLLRFCKPFCVNTDKFLMIDPTYCAVTDCEDKIKLKNHHAKGLSSETCLIPAAEGKSRPVSSSFKFITECFFMTHKALDIGFRVAYERLVRRNQDLAQMQRVLHDAESQGGDDSEVFQNLSERMESETKRYFSLRGVLLEPAKLNLMAKLHVTTAKWLVQVALDVEDADTNHSSYCPKQVKDVQFPLPENVPETLMCVPEFLIENIACFLSFARRYSPTTLEEQGFEFLNPLLTMVLVFMGSPERANNPHLRARLAECLESILPHPKEDGPEMNPNPFGYHHRERLFLEHPLRLEIIPNLLDVFVSIEMTGQSVAFEQKFNYRRPMYIIMDYLWNIEEHQNCFIHLAEEAEKNMEASNPPLFLRFINLLMNDAVFLLDEALSNMSELRTMESQRESGQWRHLSPSDRESNETNFQRTGMIARFDNILGKETIHTLENLTSKISSIFCHPTMVDRFASMLNYFLLHLVGPKSKDFKVKHQEEYEFNPGNTVLDICRIYIHLGKSEAFCAAVCQDGRSYKPELFQWAENVLIRIGSASLTPELNIVAKRIADFAEKQKDEDEALTDFPSEFQCELMFTLMRDPVILPSGQVVDRSTIARHLLSDQTNPFNRLPLTMDMVKPHTELKVRIEEWIKEKKKNRQNKD